jgi:hypothetical protein
MTQSTPGRMKLPASKTASFLPAENCKGVRFELKAAALHVEGHLYFKSDSDLMKAGLDALLGKRRKN